MKNLKKNILFLSCLLSSIFAFGQLTTYTLTTSGTFTVPTGVTSMTVECIGAGGAGGDGSSNPRSCGGGGGGAFASSVLAVTPGATINYVVGTGAANTNGGNTTWNATTIVAAGGTKGTTDGNAAGAGGTVAASTGTIRYAGGNGANGVNSTNSGGGGGGAGTTGAGGNASGATAGTGTTIGGGNGGAGRSGATENDGIAGSTYGGGGSGGHCTDATNHAGGAGANGVIYVTCVLVPPSTVTIGTGTSTTSSYPYRGSYEDSRCQIIYTASELAAAGLCSGGTISSLGFNVSSANSTAAYSGFTIKMGHTTTNTFASATWLTPTWTTVYTANYTVAAAGWNTHTFSTNFVWNGTDNIVVEVCFNNASWDTGDPVYYTGTTGATVCYAEMDGGTGCTLAAEWTSTSRPNIRLTFTGGASCSGTPVGGTSSASVTSGTCSVPSTNLSVTGHSTGCGYTYQWQSSPDNAAWSNIAGATSTTYTATTITATTYYRCNVICVASSSTTASSVSTVTISPVVGGTSSASITAATCSTNSTLSLSGNTSSGVTYQWQSSTDNVSFANIGGATAATYNATAIATTTYYKCIVTCTASGGTSASTTSTVTITAATAGTTSSSSNPVCSGVGFTLSLSGSSTSGVTYQWQSSPDNSAWTNIGGATGATYAATQTAATYYRCVVTCTASGSVLNSTSLYVTLNTPMNCYCTPAPTSVDGSGITNVTCGTINNTTTAESGNYGNYSSMYTNVTEGTLVTVNITYSTGYTYETKIWVDLNNDGDFADAGEEVYVGTSTSTNPTTLVATFTMPLGTSCGNHRMRIGGADTGPPTPCYTSSYASYEDYTLNVISLTLCSGMPTAGTVTSSISTFCNTGTPTLTTTGFTCTSGINLQWYTSATIAPYAWSVIPGATSSTYTSPTISQTAYYYCEVSCGANSATSNTVSVVNTAQTITSTNTPVSVPCGGAANLTATASGGATINWYTTLTGGTAVASGASYSPTVSTNSTFYCTASSGGTTGSVGRAMSATDGSSTSQNYGLRFDAIVPFTLVSVKVYVYDASTNVRIQLQDNTGANIGAVVAVNNLGTGWHTIPCNLSIPVGTGYRLVKANNNNRLGYHWSGGFTYASTPSGICNITSSEWGGSTTSSYYYYYDWVISTSCESSPRTPVDVTVTGVAAPNCSSYSSPTDGATGVCPVGTVIDWLASSAPCMAATSYKLYFGTDASATNIYNGVDIGNVLTYNLGNLSATTTYYWKIVPTNSGGDATSCPIQSFTTAANPGSICPGLLGAGVVPVASLPYSSGAGTTAGSGDNLTSTNTTTCGSSYYLSGEDQVFYFTPTSTGTIVINLTSTGTYTGLMLYDGCPLNTATCGAAVGSCVASATGYTGNKTLNACVTAGVTYYLILDSYASPTTNPYSNLSISAVTPLTVAANDLPCNANSLTLGVTENGNNSCTGSTSEPNAPSCWTSGIRNTVWYTVVAPASGQISVRTMLGTLLNTQIAMYQGACGSLTQVSPTSSSCNDNLTGCGSSEASQITVTGLTAGNTYYVVVDGGSDLTGTFQIVAIDPSTQSFPSTPGQDCSIAFPTCNSILSIADPGYANTGSTCDFDGSDDCTSGERSSVWYTIEIANNGFLTFDIVPNDYSGGSAGSETDYDFLVWKTGGTGATNCATMQTNSATGLVACNFSYIGVTGLNATTGNAPAAYGSSFDAAYEPRVAVSAGDQYTIVIQNYTGSTSGFTIDYTGSTAGSINYTPSPSIINWTGGHITTGTTAWATSANWGGCSIPACGISAVVGALVPRFPVISANQSVNNLTIDAGATLTINSGVTLTVCGNFVNNGTLIMAPTATLLFNNTAAHTISGNLTGTNAIGNITVTQTAGSVTFLSDIDIAGNLTTTNSTSIINSNNKYVKLAGNFVNATGNTTYTNTGTTGTLEFNGTAAQTYNQGSSQLDLNNVVMNHTSTGVTLSTNMFIKATTGTLTLTAGKINTGANVVNVVNTTPACVTTGNATSYVNGNLRRYLAAGATGSFDFPVGNTANYERANLNFTTAAAAGAIQLLARFDAWGGGWPMPGAPGWGPECAVTYNQPFLDNGYWSIDASAASTGLYNMTAYNTGYTNAAAGWSIAKSASGAPAWTTQGTCQAGPVTAVVRNAMSGFSKFATIQSSSVLPLQLLSFKGVNKTTYNELSWETASEEKISGFELESSANGFDFKMIHSRSANGTTNQSAFYKFSDYNFFSPISYYRLKIINDDNAITYSSVIAIENKQKSQMVTKVFPNPAINEVNVSMEIPFDTEMRMEIKDLLGRVVYSKTMNVSAGNQEFNINTQELSQGTYVISTYIDNLPETNNKLVISK